ncbi:rhomboid family intramembrane serine protease [Adhaeribacter sp. BT258]|uniref:Rhomboid family intramembrane serine protease n=1 Tax=Adhaeribacter terrigena TaxID=2793070 RepID=A0ABS1C298_9BACT|nr:rhomboid family intramembrane serine protease [Adhaeribacter terrigena]MBK0403526.1 rhomboid family intramembrane serine protease [Adhaeribacter terrigena]
MNDYLLKLRHILPTFLLISILTIGGFTAFRWLFTIQYQLIDIKEDFWEFWFPLALPWIAILIWLRPKLRILDFKDKDRGQFLFQFLAATTIIISSIIMQLYFTTATGKLQQVAAVEDIAKVEKARYYTISRFYPLPGAGTSHADFRTSGKYNQHLDITIYFACPIITDTLSKSFPKYWYGVNYRKQISNKLTSTEKDTIYKRFYEECLRKMNAYDFHAQEFLKRTPNSDDLDSYLKAIQNRFNITKTADFSILEPQKGTFAQRNGNKFVWIFYSYAIGLGILLIALIWPKLSQAALFRLERGIKPDRDEILETIKFLIPKGDHFATAIILDLNLLIFLLMAIFGVNLVSPNGAELLEWGGHRRHEVLHGEYWRLFTSMFVHGGIMHLFLNVSGLVIAAIFIEPLLGRKNYFILYFAAGLTASLCSVWWHENTLSVGASGAIFGLHGGLLGLLLTNAIPKEGKRFVLILIGVYVGANLLFGFAMSGIDNAAHIGGLISGAFIAIALHSYKSKEDEITLS